MKIRQWLNDRLNASEHGTKGRLAAHLGVRPDAITRMANLDPAKETREIKAHELDAIREFFSSDERYSEDDLLSTVPVMGYVGAGAEVEPDFEQVPPDGLDQISVPFPLPADMVAFQVRGDSMLPMFEDGMVIVVYRDQRRALDSFYGERAIVRTADGRRFIKTIIKGSDGRASLLSWNALPIQDVEIVWIGEIFTFFPATAIRREARRAERQGGVQGSLKLKAGANR